tara:strand:- start:197 stop:1870 length:1674 start_codon:yes stop_codon:yes gene_type:complete
MLNNTYDLKQINNGLFFISLGGIGEIGANCYLYSCDGKWIMVDLGLTFADEKFPGIELLVPNLDFIDFIKDDLEAVIISHGHEDHAGALAYLSTKIDCPVYASSFTKLLIENRLKEFGILDKINLIELNNENKINLENFKIEFISTTHSIPQPCAIKISTTYGDILHTADWKIDDIPTLGENFNKDKFEEIGNKGLLALVGDSTNANIPGYSQSENEVKDELINIFARYNKRIVVTCFSSNIARMKNIVSAAQKNNRKIVLIGRSMKKNIEAAFNSNFIKNLDVFISEEEASFIPKENLLIICTGSQGEKRSALYRIAYNTHRHINLEKDDVVIFSSRDIPGNEKSINNLKNLLIRQKVEVLTSDDDLVHVSGHGYAEEIKQMYNWTRPYLSIPVHGEPMHLDAHKKIAQSCQVPITKVLENGSCLKIAPGEPKIELKVDTGKLIVEGKNLYDSESIFIRERRKFSFEGLVLISIIINEDYSINKDIILTFKGLPEFDSKTILDEFKYIFMENFLNLSEDKKSSNSILQELIKSNVRQIIKKYSQKKPEVDVHIFRI